jgi:3-deoxy-D-manno-octulosonic-acid transferase
MRWWLYNLLLRALQPWVRRKLARRAQTEPLYGEHVAQRFGRYEGPPQPVDLWVHAVSLGEARAAGILLQALRRQAPALRVLITHGTATGWGQGQLLRLEGDRQAWLPWDTPEAVEGFLRHFQPKLGLLIETEVWPNLVRACRAHGIELVLANARLSEKSLRKALQLGFWARPTFQALGQVWAQTEADAARMAKLGVTRMGVLGNLKFDLQVDAAQVEAGRALRAALPKPVMLLASSREGEEGAWVEALAQHPTDFLPCVVPRHPQRFDEVAALLEHAGWQVLRRTRWSKDPKALAQACQSGRSALLGDTLGEMPFYYGLSPLALMGGSFGRYGGQNLIEALACACPVILGPHTYNFEQASEDAIEAQAAVRVPDMAQGVALAVQWLARTDVTQNMATHGLALLQGHRGAADRMASALLQRLGVQLTSKDR